MQTILRHGGRIRFLAAALPVALALQPGCAGARSAGGTAPAAGSPGAAAPSPAREGRFAPSRPAAQQYGQAAAPCRTGGVVTNVMAELEGSAKAAGKAPPRLDGNLCAVAETFLGWDTAAQGAPTPKVLAFVSQWFGLPATVRPPVTAVLETFKEDEVTQRIVQAMGSAILSAAYPRVGMVVRQGRRGKDTTYKVSVVLLEAPVELDPLPRRLDPGQQAKLSGRLAGGVKSPEVLVSDVTGQLSRPAQQAGEAFEAQLHCGDRPGRIQVEIRGELEGSTGPVANFPVLCGQALPDSIALGGEPWPTDPAAAGRKILELANHERTSAGLAPLAWDDAVAAVAASISSDLAARGGAPGGDVGERLKKEGIASPLVLQSAVAERSFETAHDRLLASPTNRANVMNAEVTNVGIGTAAGTDAQGRGLVYVTEVFIKERAATDVAKVRRDLKDSVARKRRDARMAPLAVDPFLDETAQKFAEALAASGGALAKEKQTELTTPLNRAMKTLTILAGAKQEPLDFAEEPQVTAVAKAVGIGAAQGKHAALGRNAVYVVIMVGTPRADAEAKPAVKGSRKGPAAKPAR